MLELPFTPDYPAKLFEKIQGFILETGCTPVIAHVDRYPAILRKPSLIKRFLEIGCLLQLNVEAFWTKHVKDFSCALLKKGLVHAVGTDMHDIEDRPPNMERFNRLLEEEFPAEVREKLKQTELAILKDKEVEVEIKSVHKLFGKYF